MRPPYYSIASINISKEMSFEEKDGNASKALLHLPLDLAVVSMSGNTGDSSNSFVSGSVRASR